MNRRVGVVSVAVLVAGAALLALAGWWLPAVAVAGAAWYPAGRCDWGRDLAARDRTIAGLRAERDVERASAERLRDELDTYHADRRVRRCADVTRLTPDNRTGYRSPAALDRKPTTPAAPRGLPAPSSATP